LYHALAAEDLILDLACSSGDYGPLSSSIEIHLDLTEKGWNALTAELHISQPDSDASFTTRQPLHIVFDYLNVLRELPSETLEQKYKQAQKMSLLHFHYRETARNMHSYSTVANWLHRGYHADNVMSAPFLMKGFDENVLRSVLNSLHAHNFRYL
jgi:secreted Zn-dependent insulinase-like peptidase